MATTATTETKKIQITLSERPPVTIVAEEWPVIARAEWHDGQVRIQANRERYIKVRRHADGRALVYGSYTSPRARDVHAGFLLEASASSDALVRAIRRVAGAIGDDALGAEVIADLPAEEI